MKLRFIQIRNIRQPRFHLNLMNDGKITDIDYDIKTEQFVFTILEKPNESLMAVHRRFITVGLNEEVEATPGYTLRPVGTFKQDFAEDSDPFFLFEERENSTLASPRDGWKLPHPNEVASSGRR